MGWATECFLRVSAFFHLTNYTYLGSNAVELLIAILALIKGDIDIVQASMIGSILSNGERDHGRRDYGLMTIVLLVLGMSYFVCPLQCFLRASADTHPGGRSPLP